MRESKLRTKQANSRGSPLNFGITSSNLFLESATTSVILPRTTPNWNQKTTWTWIFARVTHNCIIGTTTTMFVRHLGMRIHIGKRWCVVNPPAALNSTHDTPSPSCLLKWCVSCGTEAPIQGFNWFVIVTGDENVCVTVELSDFTQTRSGDTDTIEWVSYLEESVVFKWCAATDNNAL